LPQPVMESATELLCHFFFYVGIGAPPLPQRDFLLPLPPPQYSSRKSATHPLPPHLLLECLCPWLCLVTDFLPKAVCGTFRTNFPSESCSLAPFLLTAIRLNGQHPLFPPHPPTPPPPMVAEPALPRGFVSAASFDLPFFSVVFIGQASDTGRRTPCRPQIAPPGLELGWLLCLVPLWTWSQLLAVLSPAGKL